MCTAVTYHTKDHYFGRTLDLEYSYQECVVITPRNFVFDFRKKDSIKTHYAMIGMATVAEEYPLYYEAANECGLAMAGLNFPDNAYYFSEAEEKDNISPFEFIPWILSQCKNLAEARSLLNRINLCRIDFSKQLPLSPLHWIIADRDGAITVESVETELKIYENPAGVLTNNPPFDYQMTHLNNYLNLTASEPQNRFGEISLKTYGKGMGAVGLPGDWSSASRFVRACFVKNNAKSGTTENESISQFFHILGAVEQTLGCVRTAEGKYVRTVYTSCINLNQGIYYYTTYENRCISAVDLQQCNLEGSELYRYPLQKEQQVYRQNLSQ